MWIVQLNFARSKMTLSYGMNLIHPQAKYVKRFVDGDFVSSCNCYLKFLLVVTLTYYTQYFSLF